MVQTVHDVRTRMFALQACGWLLQGFGSLKSGECITVPVNVGLHAGHIPLDYPTASTFMQTAVHKKTTGSTSLTIELQFHLHRGVCAYTQRIRAS